MVRGAPKGNKFGAGNSNAGRPATYTDKDLEEMAKDLIEWAKLPTSRVYRRWLADRGLYPARCSELKLRSKAFADAVEEAKYLVGCRREELSMDGEISDGMVRTTAPIYDADLREWLIEQKKTDETKPTTIIIKNSRGAMSK